MRPLSCVVLLAGILPWAAAPVGTWAADEAPAHSIARWRTLEARFAEKLVHLDARMQRRMPAAVDAGTLAKEVEELREALHARQDTLNWRSGVLRVLRALGGSGHLMEMIFFPVLILNLLICVRFAPRPLFTGRWVFWLAGTILLLFALPVFAADSLDADLETLNRLMNETPPSKALFWLERLKGQGQTPHVAVKDDLLKPPATVRRAGAAYHLARAAFLWELGRRDETLRALRQVAETRAAGDDENVYDVTVRFLARERADSLKDIATALVPSMRDRRILARLAAFVRAHGSAGVAETATNRLAAVTLTITDVLSPLAILFDLDDREDGESLLRQSIPEIRSLSDARELLDFAIARDLDPVLETIVDKAAQPPLDRLLGDPAISGERKAAIRHGLALGMARAQIETMVLKNETPATAVDILSLATSLLKARKTSAGQHALAVATDRAKNLADVRVIVDACLANREYASSVRALERAVQLGAPDVAAEPFADPQLLYEGEKLPGDAWVSLAVLLAILDEKSGLAAGAPPSYQRGAQVEVDWMLDAAAFSFPANLRSLFYVQRHWRHRGDERRLDLLWAPYRRLLSDATLARAAALEATVAEARAAAARQARLVRELAEGKDRLVRELDRLRETNLRIGWSLLAWSLRDVAIAAAALLILYGCFHFAILHARRKVTFRAYTGFWRFNEALGWVLVLSVIGVFAGLLQVVIAQLFLLLKGVEEPTNALLDSRPSTERT